MLLNISRVSVSQNQLAFPHKSLCFVTSTSRSHWSCFARRVTDSPVETVSCWSTRITSMLPFLPDTVWILFYSYTINIGNLCRVLVCYWPRKPNDQFSHLINWIKIPISVVKKKNQSSYNCPCYVYVQLPIFGGCISEPQTVSGEHDAAAAREKKGHWRGVWLYQQRVSFFFFPPSENV